MTNLEGTVPASCREAAKVLSDRGLHVIERAGIFVRPGRTVEEVDGDEERLTGVILDDGTSLPADLVVLACGVRPRIEVARASDLPVNKGIVVNDALATQAPAVYAFGECAEHRGTLDGIVAPGWEHLILCRNLAVSYFAPDEQRNALRNLAPCAWLRTATS